MSGSSILLKLILSARSGNTPHVNNLLPLVSLEYLQKLLKLQTAERDFTTSCLHEACKGELPKHTRIVNLIMDRYDQLAESNDDGGASGMNNPAFIPDEDGYCPIYYAAVGKNLEHIKTIFQSKTTTVTDTDERGNTALHWCSLGKFKEGIEYLVEELGADIKAQNQEGKTPLDMLIYGQINVSETPKHMVNAISLAKYIQMNELHDIIPLLVPNHDDSVDWQSIEYPNRIGLFHFFVCAKVNAEAFAVYLKNTDGSVSDMTDNDGNTPITVACFNNDLDKIKELMKDMEIKKDVNGLRIAIEENNLDIVEYLLQSSEYDSSEFKDLVTKSLSKDSNTFVRGYLVNEARRENVIKENLAIEKVKSSLNVDILEFIILNCNINLKQILNVFNATEDDGADENSSDSVTNKENEDHDTRVATDDNAGNNDVHKVNHDGVGVAHELEDNHNTLKRSETKEVDNMKGEEVDNVHSTSSRATSNEAEIPEEIERENVGNQSNKDENKSKGDCSTVSNERKHMMIFVRGIKAGFKDSEQEGETKTEDDITEAETQTDSFDNDCVESETQTDDTSETEAENVHDLAITTDKQLSKNTPGDRRKMSVCDNETQTEIVASIEEEVQKIINDVIDASISEMEGSLNQNTALNVEIQTDPMENLTEAEQSININSKDRYVIDNGMIKIENLVLKIWEDTKMDICEDLQEMCETWHRKQLVKEEGKNMILAKLDAYDGNFEIDQSTIYKAVIKELKLLLQYYSERFQNETLMLHYRNYFSYKIMQKISIDAGQKWKNILQYLFKNYPKWYQRLLVKEIRHENESSEDKVLEVMMLWKIFNSDDENWGSVVEMLESESINLPETALHVKQKTKKLGKDKETAAKEILSDASIKSLSLTLASDALNIIRNLGHNIGNDDWPVDGMTPEQSLENWLIDWRNEQIGSAVDSVLLLFKALKQAQRNDVAESILSNIDTTGDLRSQTLRNLAESLNEEDVPNLCIALGLHPVEFKQATDETLDDSKRREMAFKALVLWKNKTCGLPIVKLGYLIPALNKINRNDLAESLTNDFKSAESDKLSNKILYEIARQLTSTGEGGKEWAVTDFLIFGGNMGYDDEELEDIMMKLTPGDETIPSDSQQWCDLVYNFILIWKEDKRLVFNKSHMIASLLGSIDLSGKQSLVQKLKKKLFATSKHDEKQKTREQSASSKQTSKGKQKEETHNDEKSSEK